MKQGVGLDSWPAPGCCEFVADCFAWAIVDLPFMKNGVDYAQSMEGTMRDLNLKELDAVSGGEILVSPGQLGIALTDNTLVVITGTAEAGALLHAASAIGTALGVGLAIGSALVEYTDIEHVIGGWMYNIAQCF